MIHMDLVVFVMHGVSANLPKPYDVVITSYHLTPGQVMLFCKECVMADTEEPCDIPDFLGKEFGP